MSRPEEDLDKQPSCTLNAVDKLMLPRHPNAVRCIQKMKARSFYNSKTLQLLSDCVRRLTHDHASKAGVGEDDGEQPSHGAQAVDATQVVH